MIARSKSRVLAAAEYARDVGAAQAARETGVGAGTIRKCMQRKGWKTECRWVPSPRKETIEAAEYACAVGPRRAGEETGVNADTIRLYMRKHGMKADYKRESYDLKLEVLTAIASVNPGLSFSQTELAGLLGVSRTAIQHVEERAKRHFREVGERIFSEERLRYEQPKRG